MAATQPIRNKKQVREISEYFLNRGELRNYILVVMSIHTALRISDLLRLRWADIYDFKKKQVLDTVYLTEKKTKKPKIVAINKNVKRALASFAAQKSIHENEFIFENAKTGNAISRIQAYRIIRQASENLQWKNHISCHSLRKTFGYHAWKSGASPVVIMEIYNHSSFAVTRRYLGIAQDDINKVYLSLLI